MYAVYVSASFGVKPRQGGLRAGARARVRAGDEEGRARFFAPPMSREIDGGHAVLELVGRRDDSLAVGIEQLGAEQVRKRGHGVCVCV